MREGTEQLFLARQCRGGESHWQFRRFERLGYPTAAVERGWPNLAGAERSEAARTGRPGRCGAAGDAKLAWHDGEGQQRRGSGVGWVGGGAVRPPRPTSESDVGLSVDGACRECTRQGAAAGQAEPATAFW